MKKAWTLHTTLMFLASTLLLTDLANGSQPTAGLTPEIVIRKPVEYDRSLVVSANETIRHHQQKQGLILVDVRPATASTTARIPGAMHIPLVFLETKAFLKGRPIVLVGSGHDSTALLTVCSDVNAKGFKASMLAGGIQAWVAADGPLAGNPAALILQREMRPEAFYFEKNIAERLVLFVATADDKSKKDALAPYALWISPEIKPAEIRKINVAYRENSNKYKLPLLICTADGHNHDRIAAKLGQAGLSPVLFLKGGLTAYQNYLTGIILAKRPRTNRLNKIGGCQGCGSVNVKRVTNSGLQGYRGEIK